MPSPTQGMQPTDHPDQHPNIRGVGRSHLWALTFFALPIASDLAVQLREAARSLSSGRRQQGPCSACVGSEARSVGHGMPVRNCRVLSFLVADRRQTSAGIPLSSGLVRTHICSISSCSRPSMERNRSPSIATNGRFHAPALRPFPDPGLHIDRFVRVLQHGSTFSSCRASRHCGNLFAARLL